MKNISTGFGLCVLGLGIAAWPVLDRIVPTANASGVTTAASALPAAAIAQDPPAPTVVWMGVGNLVNQGGVIYHRLWSDGRQEMRFVNASLGWNGCAYELGMAAGCAVTAWVEVPPPPSGNGFACRADLDGNRQIDGADLSVILNNWGPQPPCAPEASYPCLTMAGGNLVK
jgi:hypothetical protein